MQKVIVASVAALLVVTASNRASAQESDALPQLPSPPKPQVDVSAPAPAPAAAAARPADPRPTGVAFDLGTGVSFLSGSLARGTSLSGVQSTFTLKLTPYVSQHVGLSLAVEGGTGSLDSVCTRGCSSGYTYRVPARIEYAATNRFRGPYFDGGLSFASTLVGSSDSTRGGSPETIKLTSLLDYSFGFGFRTPVGSTALDIRLGLDLGEYDAIEYRSASASVVGAIDPSKRAMHQAVNLGIAWRFGSH